MDVTGQNIMESCGSYRFHIKFGSLIHEIKILQEILKLIKHIIEYDNNNPFPTI